VTQDWYQGYTCNMCNSKQVNTIFPDMLLKNEARVWPPYPKEAEMIQAINTELDNLWSGKKTAEQMAKDLTAAIDKVIAA
jgi:ABC-type glycerol-3-phosphate transport system substrate-binding protein